MSIYGLTATSLTSVYDYTGNKMSSAYARNGNVVFQARDDWYAEITVEMLRDSATDTAYYVIRIPQIRADGTKQYPFVYAPNGTSGGTMSTYDMIQNTGFYMGINAGYFDKFQIGSLRPYGITIQDGEIIREDDSYFTGNYTLTIDSNGKLSYANTIASGVTAQNVLDAGAISAVLGLVPLVVNGAASGVDSTQWASTERAQRQAIGQYPTGDYCVITCEGRDYDNSPGFTVSELQALCLNMGLQYAHALDGGGSTETVIGDKQLNSVYEGTTGRIVPTYIVFNGTDTFSIPD